MSISIQPRKKMSVLMQIANLLTCVDKNNRPNTNIQIICSWRKVQIEVGLINLKFLSAVTLAGCNMFQYEVHKW